MKHKESSRYKQCYRGAKYFAKKYTSDVFYLLIFIFMWGQFLGTLAYFMTLSGFWSIVLKCFNCFSPNVHKTSVPKFWLMAGKTVNARPLTPVSSDATDLEAITPNHFLLGNKNLCLPYLSSAEQFVDHRKLFRQTQAYADLIWDRFRKEYLPTLNSRKKWQTTTDRSLQQGDLVWLVEDSDKPGYYDLGRITETFEGSDAEWFD